MDLVGECSNNKVTENECTKKKTFHQDPVHQQVFKKMKQLIACNILLPYPNFELPFEIYTDTSDCQLGVVINEITGPITIFYKKHKSIQQRYTITEKELLWIQLSQ